MTDHTIKAIETQFKGYRFRSRLEARWAVFFDALGIQWEYEKEGYDLGELGWYLPDFWLPEFNQWVEVKPPTTETAKSVYLAGSFKNDWRYRFVRSEYILNDMSNQEEIAQTRIGRKYTGPFWVDLMGHCSGGHITGSGEKNKKIVYSRCLSQIDKSDIVFAWIDTMDCYGTLAEIGYAKAKGKTIWIGIDEKLNTPDEDSDRLSDQLWFAKEMASVVNVSENALDAYMKIDALSVEQIKVAALVDGTKTSPGHDIHGTIVYGDPMNRKSDYFNQKKMFRAGHLWLTKIGFLSIPDGWGFKNDFSTDFSQAAQKARSARF